MKNVRVALAALLVAVLCVHCVTAYAYEHDSEEEDEAALSGREDIETEQLVDEDAMLDEMSGVDDNARAAARMHMDPFATHKTQQQIKSKKPMMSVWRARVIRKPLTTYNMTTLLMRAFDTHNALLLMLMVDPRTVIAYSSELPAGGLYKGRRGLLELGEACLKSVRVYNSSWKISNVDEDRNTATVIRTMTGVARRTGDTVTARTMFIIKFALHHVACLDIVDLDYDVMKAALSSRAEKALCTLNELWFAHGPESPSVWDAMADNITVTLGAMSPKILFTVKGKQALIKHITSHEVPDECKLIKCLANNTEESLVLHSDANRVVTINFAGNVLGSRKFIDRMSEGTILHGVTRLAHGDRKYGLTVYFTLHEFTDDGKLTRVYVQLARPLTLLDRVHLKNVHNITILNKHDT